jgi:GAF domain-containing protein/HAMP domain-containing protein
MATIQVTPTHDTDRKKFKGSLAGTLVLTLLIFTFIPLALMTGAAYLSIRTLLQEQAIAQSQSLLATQLKIIDRAITNKETHLERLLESSDFKILSELALHANPKSSEFRDIRTGIIQEFSDLNTQGDSPSFNQFLLLDATGNIKIASNAAWQGMTLDTSVLEKTFSERHSAAIYGLAPIYNNEFILVTAQQYKTARGSTLGWLVGVTEKKNLQELIQPLNGLSPLATTYFILPDNRFVYNNPETGEFALINPGAEDKVTAIFAELMNQQSLESKTADVKSLDGKSAFAQIQWYPQMQSGIVLEIKSNDIYGKIKSLIPFTSLLALGALLAMIVAVVISNNRVVKPLRSLSDITRSFADGDWSRRAEITSNDEIGVLANSFNKMADELGTLYHSLEQKVGEGERHIRTTAKMAQNITSSADLNETLERTTELLVQQFGFLQASIFLTDHNGKYLEFKAGCGPATKGLAQEKYRIESKATSIVGWVSANNQPRIVPNVREDPLYLRNERLTETRSEAALPISIGNLVLGVLDVQSTETGAFSPDTIVTLQTLTSQIAAAIQTVELTETSQVNFEELARLYRSSRLIANANTEQEVLEISSQILKEAPLPIAILRANSKKLTVFSVTDPTREDSALFSALSKNIKADLKEIESYLLYGEVFAEISRADIPESLKEFMQALELDSAAFLPIRKEETLSAILVVGDKKSSLSPAIVQPYINLADLISISMEKAEAIRKTEKHLREVEALAAINESITGSSSLQSFFTNLLGKIQQVIGDYSLMLVLYNEKSNTINIPFSYEDGRVAAIDTFPMEESLTSLLIRTRQPLMIVEDAEKRIIELGVKAPGKPIRSWMGAPMLVQSNLIGALIIQDAVKEHAFDEEDLKFFGAIAGQAASVIHNVRLLEESQNRALQLETAAEIARDISGSLNLDELLVKAVNFIQKRFDFYHAAVFLHDLQGEYTVIREATGEIGTQMKRTGHKIGIGSKSIVGFVSNSGEQLVVNDTDKDATYYANPLFPNTRSEAAFPLKVGERILGEIDVQSNLPYAFTEDKLRSLQILADQMAVAVVNTELFSETQEHLSQHRLLHHITSTAASGTTLEEALENAVDGLRVTLGGDRVTILLTNREKNSLEIKASTGYAEDLTKKDVAIGEGITGWVAAHKRPLRVKNVAEDSRYILASPNTRSELAVPLVYRNELLGVLNVESELVDAYTENDEEMLGTLGGSLASIIANARLVEQIRVQSERDHLIYEVTSKIRRSTDIQSIMTTTANELTRLTGARYTKIHINPENKDNQEDSQ